MLDINKRLMNAARKGSEAELKALLRDPGCDVLAKDTNGLTALMWAIRGGQEACARLLLPVSDVLAKDVNGTTALMYAAGGGQEACTRLLLPSSDALAENKYGMTASMCARDCGRESFAQFIDVYVLSQSERSAIEVAVNLGALRKRAARRM